MNGIKLDPVGAALPYRMAQPSYFFIACGSFQIIRDKILVKRSMTTSTSFVEMRHPVNTDLIIYARRDKEDEGEEFASI